jgi:hypothetical protein
MGYDIVTLETQNHGQDWPLIVTAVECPTCGASVGEMCHAVGTSEGPVATNPMVNTGQQRIDWHAARKQNAAAAWYTRDTSAHQPPEAPPETIVEPEHPALEAPETKPESKGKKKGAPPPPPPPPSK